MADGRRNEEEGEGENRGKVGAGAMGGKGICLLFTREIGRRGRRGERRAVDLARSMRVREVEKEGGRKAREV